VPSSTSIFWRALLVLAVVAFVLLSGLFPDADPPKPLTGFRDDLSLELIVEAPAKAHEARNWALFGEWKRNPADSYQFWRVQSPVWVYPLAWSFRLFGVSYPTLRWFGLVIALVGVLGMVRFGRLGLPPPALAAASWAFAVNLFVTQVARSGLVEIALNTAAVWMVIALYAARRHPIWLVAAQLVFTLGFFAKAGMIYLFPLLVGVAIATFVGWWRRGEHPVARWVPVGVAVVLAVGAAIYILQPEYQRVLGWNTDHLLTGTTYGSAPWARLDLTRAYQSWLLLMPVAGAIALPGAVALAAEVVRERGADRFRLLLLLWTLSAAVALVITREWTLRHSTILFFPAYLVAGWSLWRLWQAASQARAQALALRTAVVASVAAAIGFGVAAQAQHFSWLSYEIRDVAATVRAEVGPRPAVFVGRFAVPLLLATPYDVFYIKRGFNTERDQIRALGVTHALRRNRDVVDFYLRRAWIPAPKSLRVLEFRDSALALQTFERIPDDRVATPPRGLRATSDDRIERDEGDGDDY
jgi:hypothetical protein